MPEPMSAERRAEIEKRLTDSRLGRNHWRETDLDILAIRDLLAEVGRLTAAADVDRALYDLLKEDYDADEATLRQLTEPTDAVVEAAAEAMYLAHWPHQAHRAPWESLPEWGRDGWRILARAALAAGVEAAGGGS